MKLRHAAALALVALVLATASGCVPQPSPSPTPTPVFTSEQQAFAAAEKTYRAYVDALNHVDLSDPKTFEPVYAWTTGDLNASDRKSFSNWHANGYVISGEGLITYVAPSLTLSARNVVVLACYDVSTIDVKDSSGASVVSESRPKVQELEIALVRSTQTSTGLAIRSIGPTTSHLPC